MSNKKRAIYQELLPALGPGPANLGHAASGSQSVQNALPAQQGPFGPTRRGSCFTFPKLLAATVVLDMQRANVNSTAGGSLKRNKDRRRGFETSIDVSEDSEV